MRGIILSLILLFVLVGCGPSDIDRVNEVQGDAQHIGKITKKEKDRIIVEELISNSGQPLSTIWIAVNIETEILDSKGSLIKYSDLKKGQLVEVWNDGIILESYPPKTKAVKIKVIP